MKDEPAGVDSPPSASGTSDAGSPLSDQVTALVRQLAETEARLEQITAGRIDAILDPVRGMPILLHKAQEELRRARDELEERVLQRTAELAEANQALAGANVALRAEIVAREEARAALQHYADRLQILYDMAQAILGAHSAVEIARIALDRLRQILDGARASVLVLDNGGSQITVLAAFADQETALRPGWSAPLAGAWFEKALRAGEISEVQDLRALSSAHPLAQGLASEGIRACIHVPLVTQGDVIGALEMGLERPGPFSREQIDVMREVANHLAIGIRQSDLYERVQRHAATLELRVAERTSALRASEARTQAILSGAGLGIAVVDEGGRLQQSNPALRTMLGMDREALHGRPLADFLHPDDAQAYVDLYQALMHNQRAGQQGLDLRFQGAAGEWRWGHAVLSRASGNGDWRPFCIVMIEDVTEQRQTQAALIHSEKLSLTGRLAASLAHEINNPLQSVIGCLQLAQELDAGGEEENEYLAVAVEELERAAHIVARLRDLNRRSEGHREPTDVNEILEKVLFLSDKQCRNRGIEVDWQPTPGLPPLQLAADQIEQVFLNLILNAIDATPRGGRLTVRAVQTADPPGVRISFADTGPGIEPETLDHLFEPFYSTKDTGLGLGLYVAQGIVQEHGGRITVETPPGDGTSFIVWLPLA